MKSNLFLVLISDTSHANFLNHPDILALQANGVTFNFKQCFPLEPEMAFTYVLTGCNPGKVGFFSIAELQEAVKSKQSVLSLLHNEGFSVGYSVNSFPENDNRFSFIHLTDCKLLDGMVNSIKQKNSSAFVIAPVFKEYSEKAVNINTFLRKKEIIETDSNGVIIWKDSLAYMKGYGQLWVNLIGRELEGAVSPGREYDEVRDVLIKGITEKLVDNENGQRVIEHIYKKEELFSGECLPKMPDLIVTLKQGYGFSQISNEVVFDKFPVFKKNTIIYSAGEGIFIGENIRENLNLKGVAITNIAPTVFYYMGCKIPSWMDGRVEEQFFSKEFISDNPPKYDNDKNASILSEEEDVLIRERLEGLGYL